MGELPKIVHDRLGASLPANLAHAHPDADMLTAFAEQTVSADERERILQHLALCGDCREVLSLSLHQEPSSPESVADRSQTARVRPPRERVWFTWPRLRWAALAAGLVVAAAILLLHPAKQSSPSEAKQSPANVTAPQETIAEKQTPSVPATSPVASAKEEAERQEPPPRELDRDKTLASADATEPHAPSTRLDDMSRTRVAARSVPQIQSGARIFGPLQSNNIQNNSNQLVKNDQPARRDMGVVLGELRNGSPGENAAGGAASAPKPLTTYSEQRYENRSASTEDNKKTQSTTILTRGNLSAGLADERKDVTLKAAPARAESQTAPAPPPIPTVNETVTVTGESVAVETASADKIVSKGATPVTKAKEPAKELAKVVPEAKASESATDEWVVSSSQVANLTVNGRSFTTMERLSPQWRLSGGVLQRSANSSDWQTALHAQRALLCYAANGNEVWAGGKKGSLFHSSDGGTSFTQVYPTTKGQKLTADVTKIEGRSPTETVLSTSKGETWTSADNGKTWEKK